MVQSWRTAFSLERGAMSEAEELSALIGEIYVDPQDIFDVNDPKENKVLFRAANRLHITTRESVVRERTKCRRRP